MAHLAHAHYEAAGVAWRRAAAAHAAHALSHDGAIGKTPSTSGTTSSATTTSGHGDGCGALPAASEALAARVQVNPLFMVCVC